LSEIDSFVWRPIVDQARTIRIPVHMIETINKIVPTSHHTMHEIGREPTLEELAEKLSMPLFRAAMGRCPVKYGPWWQLTCSCFIAS
jgi:Sigma-70 region 3